MRGRWIVAAAALAAPLGVASARAPRGAVIEPMPVTATPDGRNEVRLELAEALIDAGSPTQARQVLDLAREEGADEGEIVLLQGRALAAEGLYGQAETLLLEARKAMPRDARPYRALGLLRADIGDPVGAIDVLEDAVRLDPNDAATWNNLGFLQLSQGQIDPACESLEQAVTLDGATPRYRSNLGFALAAAGRDREALAAFRGAGTEADARSNLGLAYEMNNRPSEALVQYRAALDANPHHPQALEGLRRTEPVETP